MKKPKITLLYIVLIISLITTTGCDVSLYKTGTTPNPDPVVLPNDDVTDAIKDDTDNTETVTNYEPISLNPALSVAVSIDGMIKAMSLKEKVAQLFIVDFYGMTREYELKKYTSSMDSFLRKYPVGGIIYFTENIESPDQLVELNRQFSTMSQIPLFISVDEEGGLVSRLGKANVGVTQLPTATEMAEGSSPEEVYALAKQLGQEISDLGFNMNFAPVLDVNTNPDNPVIGTRSFGQTADIVSTYSSGFINGLRDSGIVSSGKHFPGHGDTTTDSHTELTIIEHNQKRLDTIELIPFKAAIGLGIPSIMIGHINAPNITKNNLPASLSPDIIQKLLRDKLGFDGLVITDSLRMSAITDYYNSFDVGVMLLKAGGDVILIPDDFAATFDGIINALKKGTLKEERIDESVRRILKVKADYGIIKFPE